MDHWAKNKICFYFKKLNSRNCKKRQLHNCVAFDFSKTRKSKRYVFEKCWHPQKLVTSSKATHTKRCIIHWHIIMQSFLPLAFMILELRRVGGENPPPSGSFCSTIKKSQNIMNMFLLFMSSLIALIVKNSHILDGTYLSF